MYLPDELERLRIEQNLSVRGLARLAELSPPTTTGALEGRGNVRSVVKVANALKYSIKWTFEDDETCQRRVLLLPGSLQTQVATWRKKYTKATLASLVAPGLCVDTIRSIERGQPCRYSTLEKLARLVGLEATLVRGTAHNVVDMMEKGHGTTASTA